MSVSVITILSFILLFLLSLGFIRRNGKAEKTVKHLSAFLVCHENDVLEQVKIRTESLRTYVRRLKKIDMIFHEEIKKVEREVDEEKARHRPRKTVLKRLGEKLGTIEEILLKMDE